MYEFTVDRVNPDSLDQDEVWYDRKGVCHKIDEMPYSYVKSVIKYLKYKIPLNVEGSKLLRALQARERYCRHALMEGRRY